MKLAQRAGSMFALCRLSFMHASYLLDGCSMLLDHVNGV